MIDVQKLREDSDFVRQKTKEKRVDVDFDELLRLDADRLVLIRDVEELRKRRNEISDSMKSAGGGKPDQALIDEGKELKVELAEREALLAETEAQFNELFARVPNPHFDDVPIGDEGEGIEIERFGDCETVGAEDHLDLGVRKGWIDFERGAKVAGTKFYFLQGDLALLENALVQYAIEVTTKAGFTYMTVPHIVNERVAAGAGFSPRNDDAGNEYFVEGEGLTLIATAEAPLTGYRADEIIDEKDIPLLYVGYSPCYRKEAGTYGKHTRGLFRVHQFNKVEMYAFTLAEKSSEVHEQILGIEKQIWQDIGIPYHIINIPSGDLGAPAAKKYDIEYWSKVDGTFRELTSCSNCTDFQTRNLNIRVRRADGKVELLHSLNGTAISTARTLIAIMEHFQDGEGNVKVPEVLKKYMAGKELI